MTGWLQAIMAFGVTLTAACFGDGPVPNNPSEAVQLYAVTAPSANCGPASYIGSVAIGALSDGYVVALPYMRNNGDCNNGGSPPPSVAVTVDTFRKDRTMFGVFGPAGTSDGTHGPQIASAGMTGVWAYQQMMPTNAMVVAPGLGSISSNQGAVFPAGIVADDTMIYVAGWQQGTGGRAEVNNPNYPCCGPSSTGNVPGTNLSKLPIGGGSSVMLPVMPAYACESMSECMVANTSSLFFMEHADPAHVAKITRFPKTGTTAAQLTMIGTVDNPGSGKVVPVGLAADDAHVAWSASVEYELQRSEDPLPQPLCVIEALDLTTQVTTRLLSTTNFSCMHAAVDAGFVYFTIVSIDRGQNHMHGDGVGRVSFADQTFESIALGIAGDGAGPRRVYVVADTMYLVDPSVIGAIKSSALVGKHDFAP